jgi:hypothetical protein
VSTEATCPYCNGTRVMPGDSADPGAPCVTCNATGVVAMSTETEARGIGRFLDAMENELNEAMGAHPPINSTHEGYSVILEELDEFWDEVKRKRAERDSGAMYAELVQIAAMAARTAVDCGLDRGSS